MGRKDDDGEEEEEEKEVMVVDASATLPGAGARVRLRACGRKSGGRERQRREAEEHQTPAEEPTQRMLGDSDVAVVFIRPYLFYFSSRPVAQTFDSTSSGKEKRNQACRSSGTPISRTFFVRETNSKGGAIGNK